MTGIKSASGMRKRIGKLVEAGLLELMPNSQATGRSYYCITSSYSKIVYKDNVDPVLKVQVPSLKCVEPCPESVDPVLIRTTPRPESAQDYITNNNITTLKETIKKKNENKSSLFQNSEVYKLVQKDENDNILDISKLKELFKENGAEKIDFAYYFKAIDDWTLQKPIKRTNKGWIATFRTFIRKDKDAKKLHIYDPFNQPDFDLKAACEKYNL